VRTTHLAIAALLSVAGCSRDGDEGWRVYAAEYGHSEHFPRKALVHGESDGTQPLSWLVFVIRGHDRVILVDTGFDDPDLARRKGVGDFRTAPEALAELDVAPEQVGDVVLTHLHWDHAGNLSPWAQATFWLQADELEWAEGRVSVEQPRRGGLYLEDIRAVSGLVGAGRVQLVDGRAEVAPGIVLHRGGAHTTAIQWVEVRTGRTPGTIVLASDNAYLYENLEEHVPIGASRDARANLAELDRMLELASRTDLVVPGHDPQILERHRRRGDRVVEIR